MSKIIRWEELPERSYKSGHRDTKYEFIDICKELCQKPMQWAIIRICGTAKEAHNLAWLLNEQRIKLPDEGDFEFSSRISPRQEFAVYARFLGKK